VEPKILWSMSVMNNLILHYTLIITAFDFIVLLMEKFFFIKLKQNSGTRG